MELWGKREQEISDQTRPSFTCVTFDLWPVTGVWDTRYTFLCFKQLEFLFVAAQEKQSFTWRMTFCGLLVWFYLKSLSFWSVSKSSFVLLQNIFWGPILMFRLLYFSAWGKWVCKCHFFHQVGEENPRNTWDDIQGHLNSEWIGSLFTLLFRKCLLPAFTAQF